MNHPYVYKLIHKDTKQFYIGYREANIFEAEYDIGFKYFTSSKYVHSLGFDNFDIQILSKFNTPADAYWYEQKLISENISDILCINKHYIRHDGKIRFKFNGHTQESLSKMRKPRSEAGKLAMRGIKKRVSNLPRKPISKDKLESMRVARFLRKHPKPSEDNIQKLKLANMGNSYTKGMKAYYNPNTSECGLFLQKPEGWILGDPNRLGKSSNTKGKNIFYNPNNGVETICCALGAQPDGWIKGSPKLLGNDGGGTKGAKWYHSLDNSQEQRYKSNQQPEGWLVGRKVKTNV